MTTTSDKSWLAEVTEVDSDYYKIPYVYEFSNNRKFLCTDSSHMGIYGKRISLESGFGILTEGEDHILREG